MMEGTVEVASPESVASSTTSCVSTRELDTTVSSGSAGTVCSPTKQSGINSLSVRDVWEMYMRTVKSQDKSADNVERQTALLDLLLGMWSAEMDKGTFTEFGDTKGLCNQLCSEFMSDILHITSRSEDEDVTELQKYLLEGRGWLLLQVLHRKGVQSINGCQDLANLLVSLLPWCLKFPIKTAESQAIDLAQSSTLPPISHCFQNILRTSHGKNNQIRKQAVPATRQSNMSPQDLGGQTFSETGSGKRRYSKRRLDSKGSKDAKAESDNDSSEVTGERVCKMKRKSRYYHIHGSADRHTQQKVDSDSDDDDLSVLLKNIKIVKSTSSGYELCVLILDLLYDLSLCDLDEMSAGKLISLSILPHLLPCLASVETNQKDGSEILQHHEARKNILRHLLRVVFASCSVIASQQNGMNILIGHKVISHVLNVGHSVEAFRLIEKDDHLPYENYVTDLNIISDVIVGLVLCLNVVFENLPFNLSFINTAVSLIEEFDDHKGFQMLEYCVMFYDRLKQQSADNTATFYWLDDEPVKLFGTLLNAMKVVRVNYLHSMKCVKRKHQKCTYAQYFDHHHDILGVPATVNTGQSQELVPSERTVQTKAFSQESATSKKSSPTVCLVSTCTHFLLDLLIKVVSKGTRLDLLKIIYSAGVCCCMNLNDIVSTFVLGIEKFSPAVRIYAIDTLNRIVLEHFTGGLPSVKGNMRVISCSYCDNLASATQCETAVDSCCRDDIGNSHATYLDSGIDSNDPGREAKVTARNKFSKWRSVGQLKKLLYSNNDALATSVAKHLMVLAVKGNGFLKAELFFSLYMHALESVGKGGSSSSSGPSRTTEDSSWKSNQSLSKSVQVHCLSALPYLLQANCVTKAFLTKKGVRKLCELLEDEVLRAPVLKIFEALVVLDEQKLDLTDQVLSEDCPCPYKGGLVIDAFINELSKRSFDSESDTYIDESEPRKGRIRRESVVLSKFSLPVLVDLWETCAKLCIHSHVFLLQFQECLVKTETLLLETLDILINPHVIDFLKSQGSAEDSGMECDSVPSASGTEKMDSGGFFMRLSLIESLMVVVGAGHNRYGRNSVKLKMWERVKDRFRHNLKLEPTKLKMFLDTVMNSAMPQFVSLLEYSYSRNVAMVYIRDDDIYDEDEVRQLLQTGSDEEQEMMTEIGYDADSECTINDESQRDKHLRSLLQSRTPLKVYFPSTFRLLIDLLVLLQMQDNSGMVVNPVLHKLVQSVCTDNNIVKAMCEQDVLSVILDKSGFWPSLVDGETEKTVLSNLLTLIQQLGQQKLQSCDLQKLLQLFQHSKISMENLLSVLQNIVKFSKVTSHHSVVFPAHGTGCTPPLAHEVLETETLVDSVRPLLKNVSSIFSLGLSKVEQNDTYLPINVSQSRQEVWRTCALQLSLKDFLTWPPFQNGFSIAMWLCLEKGMKQTYYPKMPSYDTDIIPDATDSWDVTDNQRRESSVSKCLHVVSIGTRDKLLEVWADAETDSLLFRLTSDVSDSLVVQETKLDGILSTSSWQHLVISYVEALDGSTLTGQATVVLDGCKSHNFNLDHSFSAIRLRHKSAQIAPQLCIGHVIENPAISQTGVWSLGNFMLFKGASISKETCFHLYSLGPNCGSMLKCDCSDEMTSYAPHLHKDTVLHSKIDTDILVGLKKPDLTDLRCSILLSFNPKKYEEMSIYSPVSKVNQGQIPTNLGYTPDSLLSQQPKVAVPSAQGHMVAKVNASLEKAIEESGGMAAMLFLVAKVYEKCPESMAGEEAERIQAEALKVLFSMVHHSSSLQQEYIDIGGHSLLCKVLTSCRSVLGQQVLKVLMDTCTTESIYKQMPGSSNLILRQKSEAVIRDISVIEQLILQWQIWEGSNDPRIIEILFSGLANLVREDHPHQSYNIKQYQVINLVNKIFKIYQERIQEGLPALPMSVSQSVVSIVQNMTGSPPDYHLIIDICDFVLMVHPAANTYINHSRSAFYFTLPWGLPLSPLTKWKQGLGQGISTSTPIKDTDSGFTPEIAAADVKRNLLEPLEASFSQAAFPAVEQLNTTELKTINKAVSDTEKLIPDSKPVSNDATRSDIETVPEHETKHVTYSGKLEIGIDIVKREETLQKELTTEQSLQTQGSLISSTETQPPSTNIPSNFESLYKKANSFEEDELQGEMIGQEFIKPTSDEDSDDAAEDKVSNGGYTPKDDFSLTFDEDNVELLKQEQGLTALCVGLLRHLSSIILTMPDGMIEKTFQKAIIYPQTFIVLAQNSSSEVREAVIKVLSAYLNRSSGPFIDSFLKIDGFHLLSAQLFQYPTHQEQMESAVAVVLQRPFHIDDGLHPDEIIEDLSRIQQSAICMVLTLLGNSVGDLALCHNSLQLCCKLYDMSDVVATVMMENGVVEVLCNMLMKLLKRSARNTDVEGMDENEILLSDLLDFYKVIAIREFSASGLQHYQHFEDVIVVLQDMERIETCAQGIDSKSSQTLQVLQHHILVAILTIVEKASEEVCQHSFSFFNRSSKSSINYESPPAQQPSTPTLATPAHRNLSLATEHFSLSGTFGRLPFHKKSPGGYFVQSDHPFSELSTQSGGSGGESDSESFQSSVQTVNLPVLKHGYNRSRSIDISQGRLVRSNSLLQTVLSIGKRKKLATIPISQNELIDRLKKMITMAVDTAIYTKRKTTTTGKKIILLFETVPQSVNLEREFHKRLFNFAYRAFEATLPQEKTSYKKTKNVIMWGAKDVLRVQLGRFLSFMLSDRVDIDQRVYTLSFLMGEHRGMEVLKMLVTAPDLGNDLGYFIHDLMVEGKKWLSKQQVEDGSKLINHLRSLNFVVLSPRNVLTKEDQDILLERKKLIWSKHESHKASWLKKRDSSLNRIFHQYDSLSSRLCDNAMEVTQSVTQLQTRERNKFITHIKHKKTESIQVKKQWQEIVLSLTHERALWYDVKSYPNCWQLNPTEGPCRVRKRLQRGHLGISPKFIKKESQFNLATETVDPPLIYLFEDDHQMSDSAALIYQLHKNNKIRYTSTCRAVSPNSESKGELLIGEDSVFFVADEAITDANYTQVLLGNRDQLSMTWPFEDILEIQRRWYELTDTALEIFLTNGKTCLLALKSAKDRDDLFQHLIMLELPSKIDTGNLLDIVDRWQDGHITNYEYLTYLNKIAGRSFNDLMQYPIMPFILSDYTSPSIDLRDMSKYRDLSKPVSVQDSKNANKFITNYTILKQEYEKFDKADITGLRVAPYHYGSHYSNSGSVLHFLVRLPPFTKMFLNFQDQSFDIPDRTFHNLHTSWRLSSAESNTDVKELIPEFFFSHEFLTNSEDFDFGKRQNDEPVHDVVLPPWCGGNPRHFILIHRQALESDYVTENIGGWIDLVFGYKQQGEPAVRAVNVFHPATYFGLDVSSVKNALDRKAIRTMVRTYGQTPKQLFKVTHPRKTIDYHRKESPRQGTQLSLLKHVAGIKWGSYLGSPACPTPEIVWEYVYTSQVASLIALPTGLVFGISAKSCLLVEHSQEKQRAILIDTLSDVVWAAIVTWGQSDGLVRIINGKNKPPVNFIQYTQSDEITCCVSVSDCRHLFMGGSSGIITVYNTKHNPAKESELQVFGHKRCLYGHTAVINSLVVCKAYSILVSASQDSTCIIWDLNRLSYVRTIRDHKSGVHALAVSDTLGDIASVSHHGLGSHLHLHTVNAEFVTMVTCQDTINCLAYSGAPEGVSVNVIAGGLSSGIIRMWNSWDLTHVRDLTYNHLVATPIISLTFTRDSQKLYSSSANGRVILWDYSGNPRPKTSRFRPFLYPSLSS